VTARELTALVVGAGNDYRGDDASGLAVARQIQKAGLAGVAIREETGDIGEVSERWADFPFVVLIDAARSGAAPGTIFRFDARRERIPHVFTTHVSSHGFGVAEAIALAEALDRLPATLIIYGIEGQNFAPGAALSPAVQSAVSTLTRRVIAELRPQSRRRAL
jgi:hydrogenase maturation protease